MYGEERRIGQSVDRKDIFIDVLRKFQTLTFWCTVYTMGSSKSTLGSWTLTLCFTGQVLRSPWRGELSRRDSRPANRPNVEMSTYPCLVFGVCWARSQMISFPGSTWAGAGHM